MNMYRGFHKKSFFKVTPCIIRRIQRLHSQGKKQTEIAVIMGIGQSTVSKYLRQKDTLQEQPARV